MCSVIRELENIMTSLTTLLLGITLGDSDTSYMFLPSGRLTSLKSTHLIDRPMTYHFPQAYTTISSLPQLHWELMRPLLLITDISTSTFSFSPLIFVTLVREKWNIHRITQTLLYLQKWGCIWPAVILWNSQPCTDTKTLIWGVKSVQVVNVWIGGKLNT